MTNSIIPIVSLWEEFIHLQQGGSATDFAHWIIKKNNVSIGVNRGNEYESMVDNNSIEPTKLDQNG